MTVETFFEKFELFADTPNAVEKMRELVLKLAVTGQLVDVDRGAGPNDHFVQSLRDQRERLVANRKIKERRIEPVSVDEQPFSAHEHWRWLRLCEVGYELGQKEPDGPFVYIDVSSIDSERGQISDRVETLMPDEAPSRARKIVKRGTVIYSTVRPYLRNIAIVDRDFDPEPIASTAFGILYPFQGVNARYLFYWLRSGPFTEYVQDGMKGMAYPAINDEKFYSGFIALPPLAEQTRIVAKIDELMALCDQLEAQQADREKKHAGVVRAALARFSEAPTPANLQYLFHPAYTIDPADLRKSILTLAVEGKLVQPDVNDTPVAETLEHNDARRRALAAEDRRADVEAQVLLSADDCWEIPQTWSWRGLADLTLFVDYRGKTPIKVYSGIRLLTAKNVRKGFIDLSPEEFISKREYDEWMTRGFPTVGDVLFTTEAPMGNAAVIRFTEKFALAQRVICFRTYGALDSDFLVLQILSEQFQSILNINGTGVTAKGIKAAKLKRLPIAVPPLAEQRRIVSKVDELMELIERLEADLAAARRTGASLMDAALHELISSRGP